MNAQALRALQQVFAQQAQRDDGLVSFRAGRLFMDEQTKMVTADKKRGKIKLLKDEHGLLKFQWMNRISNEKELDLTLFSQSAKWEKVTECTDGRVFLLRMMGSNRKHFFWMQEPKDDKDDEYFTNINKLCNGETIGDQKPSSSAASGGTAAATNPYAALGAAGGGANAGQDALAQMIADALRNQGGGGGGANNTGSNNNNNTGSNNTGANNTGSNNNNTGSSGAAGGGGANLLEQMANMMREQQRAQLEEMKREPDLEDILDPNANQEIVALLDDEKIVEELGQYLPEGMRSRNDMIEQLQSPQFQGALRRLQTAINGTQMTTLLQGMGINPPNQNAMGVTAFVNAIQPNNISSSEQQQKEDKDKEKDKEKEKEDKGDKDKEDKDKEKDANKNDDDGDAVMENKDGNKDANKDKDNNDDIDDIYK